MKREINEIYRSIDYVLRKQKSYLLIITLSFLLSACKGSSIPIHIQNLITSPVASVSVSTSNSYMTASSNTVASGSSVTVTLFSKDADNNSITSGGLAVVFSFSGGTSTGTLSAVTDNGNGTYTATLTGVVVGTASTVSATINGNAVTSVLPTVTVNVGAASQLSISAIPAPLGLNSATTLVVTAQDVNGNTVTSYTGTVGFTSTDPQASLPANYAFVAGDNGTHTFAGLTLRTPITQTVTVTDQVTSSITGSKLVRLGIEITGFTLGGSASETEVSVTSVAGLSNNDVVVIHGTTNYNGSYTIYNLSGTGFTIRATYVAESASGAYYKGGNVLGGCQSIETGVAGAITIPALNTTTISRFQGVAPLAVFFDFTGTTATATTKPFHELEYSWSFGDTSSGTWSYGTRPGSASKNTAKGGVAAHVFKTPGIYNVTLTAKDGSNTISNNCVQIAVQDPDVYFSGTNTICLSSAGDFTNCPTGANQVTYASADFDQAMTTYAANQKRILFRRGETWLNSASPNFTKLGPGIIGAYGPSGDAKPIIRANAGAYMLSISSSATASVSDWRIMDLELDGNSIGTYGFYANGSFSKFTFADLNIHHTGSIFMFSESLLNFQNNPVLISPVWDQLTIADSNFHDLVTGNSLYIAGTKFAYIGNNLENISGNGLRSTYLNKAFVSENSFFNSTGGTSHLLRVESVPFAGNFTYSAGLYTEYYVFSNNKFSGTANSLLVSLAEYTSTDTRLRHGLIEGNFFKAGASTQNALWIESSSTTARNNIIDTSGGVAHQGISIKFNNSSGTRPYPDSVWIYNNTFYSSDTDNDFIGTIIGNTNMTNILIKNNIAYAPNDSLHKLLDVTGAPGYTASNNSTTAQVQSTNPQFVSATPSTSSDFCLGSSSYGVDAGAIVPLLYDFFEVIRPRNGLFDMGACEY